MKQYKIPEIDLVIVDLYPFEETVASTSDEKPIIEKIDIGGPSMIRGAAKNFKDVVVIAAKTDYAHLKNYLHNQKGETTLEQRRVFAAKAFEIWHIMMSPLPNISILQNAPYIFLNPLPTQIACAMAKTRTSRQFFMETLMNCLIN